MAPPSLTFEDKQFPSKQLTRQIIYDYLAPVTLEQLQKLQEACSFCQAKSSLISKGDTIFQMIHGILCFKKEKQPLKMVIPEIIAKELITKIHGNNKLIHSSQDKMGVILKNVFFFKIFDKIARQTVKECTLCQQHKPAKVWKNSNLPQSIAILPKEKSKH